jgi:hypothetical protein
VPATGGLLPQAGVYELTPLKRHFHRAPLDQLLAYRERMGWSFTWASSHESDRPRVAAKAISP